MLFVSIEWMYWADITRTITLDGGHRWVTLRVIASAQHSLCDGPVPFVPVSETWLGWQPTAVVLLYCLKEPTRSSRL